MAKKNERHNATSSATPMGGWDVKKPGASRASAHEDTQKAATDRAREIVSNQGGGEVVIHGTDGKIRDRTPSHPATIRTRRRISGRVRG